MKRSGGRAHPMRRGVLLVALLVALALAPTAADAQTGLTPTSVQVRLDPASLRIEPLAPPKTVSGIVELHLSAPSAERVTVELEVVQQPAWASVVLDPPTLQIDPAPGAQVLQGAFRVHVRLDERAPAFTPAALVIEARSARTLAHDAAHGEGGLQVLAEYRGLVAAKPETGIVHVQPGALTRVPVTLTNLGNAATRVVLEVAENPDRLSIQLPPPVVLDASTTGGTLTEAVVLLRVGAPEGFQSPGRLALYVRTAYALDSTLEGDWTWLELQLTGRGGGAPSVQPQPREGPVGPGTPPGGDDSSLLVQTGDGRARHDDGPGAWPWTGAIAGGAAGFVLARRRLPDGA